MTIFLDQYRKHQTPEQTHFCPGCGHGNLLKFVDKAIAEFGAEQKTIWVSPVGCGGLTDSYLSVSHVLAAHGRASAVGTSVKRLNPDALVIVSQGDGDLASIGLLEAVHAANRGENLTVFFVNNANFGMTGGQMAPTTMLGQHTATSPQGRCLPEHGAPLKICEMLNQLEGPAYIARVAIGSEKQLIMAEQCIRHAIENQIYGRGYSFVEILSPCPSNWHLTPVQARDRVADEMTKVFPIGVLRDISRSEWITARQRIEPYHPRNTTQVFETITYETASRSNRRLYGIERLTSICCAGFGGQGVMTLGRKIARYALESGLEATWIPSYGPEMRGGVANCFVRIDKNRISSPIVDHPDVLFAMSQPALDCFMPRVVSGGTVIFDCDTAQITEDIMRSDIQIIAVPATSQAVASGNPRNANILLLEAWDAVIM